MATIRNTSERVYRLKGDKNKNSRYTEVTLRPGPNAVKDRDWADVKDNWFTVILLEEGKIVSIAGPKKGEQVNTDTGREKIASVQANLPKDPAAKQDTSAIDKAVELARENERLKIEAKGNAVDTSKVELNVEAPVVEATVVVEEEKTPVKESTPTTDAQRMIAEAAQRVNQNKKS